MSARRRFASLLLLTCIFLFEGYDLNAMPLALPHLGDALGMEPGDFGLVFSAVLVGLGGGAALLAPLGDRIGRKPVIVAGTLIVALATIATASSASITEFALWRLVTGIGLGAILPNCSAMAAELAPGETRARLMTLVSAGIPAGAMIAGMTAPEVVAMGSWRALFLLPGCFGIVLALLAVFIVPHVKPTSTNSPSRVPQFELFRAPWLFPFAVYTACLTLNAGALYMLSQWAPTMLPDAGFTIAQASRLTGLLQGGGFAVGLGLAWLIDRWRPSIAIGATFVIVAGAFLAIGLISPTPAMWTPLLLVAGGGVTGMSMALTALVPSLFPAHLYSSAIGMGVLIARLGAIAGPLAGGAIYASGAAPGLFFIALFAPAGLCVLICLALPAALSVKRRLEEVAGRNANSPA